MLISHCTDAGSHYWCALAHLYICNFCFALPPSAFCSTLPPLDFCFAAPASDVCVTLFVNASCISLLASVETVAWPCSYLKKYDPSETPTSKKTQNVDQNVDQKLSLENIRSNLSNAASRNFIRLLDEKLHCFKDKSYCSKFLEFYNDQRHH